MSKPIKSPSSVIHIFNSRISSVSLTKNISWSLLGNIIYALCQFSLLIVIARLGTPKSVGQFTLGLAVTAPLYMFARLQLRTVIAMDSQSQYSFSDYLHLRFFMACIAFIVTICIICIVGYETETTKVIIAVSIYRAIETLGECYYGALQKIERMDYISISVILKGIFSISSLAATFYFTQSLFYAILSMSLFSLILLYIYDLNCFLRVKLSSSDTFFFNTCQISNILHIARSTFPLGLASLLGSLYANIPRYFLERYFSEKELGIFASIAYIMVSGTIFIRSLCQSFSYRISNSYASNDKHRIKLILARLLLFASILGASITLISWLAGEHILLFLYGTEYAAYSDILAGMMFVAGFVFVADIMLYFIIASHQYRSWTLILLFANITSTIAAYLAVPTLQLWGATISQGVGTITLCIGGFLLVVKSLRQMSR